jgi:hypothetical protein
VLSAGSIKRASAAASIFSIKSCTGAYHPVSGFKFQVFSTEN